MCFELLMVSYFTKLQENITLIAYQRQARIIRMPVGVLFFFFFWLIWLNVRKRAELSVDISIFSISHKSHFLQITTSLQSLNQVLPIQFILPTTALLCRRTRHWARHPPHPPPPPLAPPLSLCYESSFMSIDVSIRITFNFQYPF